MRFTLAALVVGLMLGWAFASSTPNWPPITPQAGFCIDPYGQPMPCPTQ